MSKPDVYLVPEPARVQLRVAGRVVTRAFDAGEHVALTRDDVLALQHLKTNGSAEILTAAKSTRTAPKGRRRGGNR